MNHMRLPHRQAVSRFIFPATLSVAVLLFCILTGLAAPDPVTGLSSAITLSTTNSGPRISFGEPMFDFGTVDSGTMIKHDYVFTNTGNHTLEVTAVQPACGCTTANAWDKTVEPGKTGTIPIQFNSTGYGGPVVKTITVSCNDPEQTNVILQLKGTIFKPIEVVPAFAMFNIYPDTPTNETKVVRIVSNLDEPLTLSEPVCTNSAFQAALKVVKEGKEFALDITVVPPVTNTVSTQITLKTSSQKVPSLSVTAYASAVAAVAVSPPQITLPAGPLASEIKPTITVKNNSTNSLAVSEPAINTQDADIQLKEVQTGRVFTVSLKFPVGFRIQPGQSVEATFKTTNPKFPLIKVPIYQVPAPAAAAPPKTASTPDSATPPHNVVSTSSLTRATTANDKK